MPNKYSIKRVILGPLPAGGKTGRIAGGKRFLQGLIHFFFLVAIAFIRCFSGGSFRVHMCRSFLDYLLSCN